MCIKRRPGPGVSPLTPHWHDAHAQLLSVCLCIKYNHEPGEITSQLPITAATQGDRRTAVEATHCRHVLARGHRIREKMQQHKT